MRRVALFLFILVAGVSSCQKDAGTPAASQQPLGASTLPLKAANYVALNFPSERITSAIQLSNGSNNYIVTLNSLQVLTFDSQGNFTGTAADYSVPGQDVSPFLQSGSGTGFLMAELGETSIPLALVPHSIGNYITSNYAGYKILHTEMDNICELGKVYEVIIAQSKLNPMMLFFDTAGIYVAQAEMGQYANVPAVIQDFIAAKYPGYTHRSNIVLITLADGKYLYNLFLSSNGQNVSVIVGGSNGGESSSCESSV